MTRRPSTHAAAAQPAVQATPRTVLLYFCDTLCTVDNAAKHAKKSSFIYFLAVGTDVRLSFTTSPFEDGTLIIDINANSFVFEKLKPVTSKETHHCSFSCTKCGTDAGEADINVEP